MFKLPQLTYSKSALEPFLSTESIEYHYGRHHKSYISEVNRLIQGTKFENSRLEEIILNGDGALLNNASLAWNHTFYWRCMSAADKAAHHVPSEVLTSELRRSFGSVKEFNRIFTLQAVQLLGSGWIWLVTDNEKRMQIVTFPNADSPIRYGFIPLLVCDVWEHAYHIDYRNNRRRYIEGFIAAIDWAFVSRNYQSLYIPDMSRLMVDSGRSKRENEISPQHSVA